MEAVAVDVEGTAAAAVAAVVAVDGANVAAEAFGVVVVETEGVAAGGVIAVAAAVAVGEMTDSAQAERIQTPHSQRPQHSRQTLQKHREPFLRGRPQHCLAVFLGSKESLALIDLET